MRSLKATANRATGNQLKAFALVMLVGLLGAGYWFTRKETLVDGANNLRACIERGDGECLFRYAMPSETQALGLSPEKLQRLLNEYVQPAFRQYKKLAGNPAEGSKEQAYYSSSVRYEGEGKQASLAAIVHLTDSGPKAFVASGLLLQSMIAKHRKPGQALEGTGKSEILLRGMTEDRAQLEAMGFQGFMDSNSNTFISWNTYIEYARKKLSKSPPP